MTSLIQQRMAIDRERLFGILNVIFGSFFAVFAVLELIVARGHATGYIYLVISGVWFVVGGRKLMKAAKARSAFEATHGKDAGKQPPRAS